MYFIVNTQNVICLINASWNNINERAIIRQELNVRVKMNSSRLLNSLLFSLYDNSVPIKADFSVLFLMQEPEWNNEQNNNSRYAATEWDFSKKVEETSEHSDWRGKRDNFLLAYANDKSRLASVLHTFLSRWNFSLIKRKSAYNIIWLN